MPNCLIIEDSADHRELMLPRLEHLDYLDIIAPVDQIECQFKIVPEQLAVAVIDFKLWDWIGNANKESLMMGGKPINDGVDLAEHLYEANPNIIICLYSSASKILHEKLNFSKVKSRVKKTFEFGLNDDSYAPIEEFLIDVKDAALNNWQSQETAIPAINLIRITRSISWLKGDPGQMSPALQLYYYRQLLSLTRRKKDMWKAGEHAWRVSSTESSADNKLLQAPALQNTPGDHFDIWIDPERNLISGIRDAKHQFAISAASFPEALARIESAPRYELLFELFIVKSTCGRYLSEEISQGEAIRMLKCLSPLAQLESQKYLFRKLIMEYDAPPDREDIYSAMLPFHEAGMNKIIDIYEGHIVEVKETYAVATLTSLLDPEDQIVKRLNPKVMKSYLFEQDSVFEYVISTDGSPNSFSQQFLLISQ